MSTIEQTDTDDRMVVPKYQKILLDRLDLPVDILDIIEEMLKIRLTKKKIDSMFEKMYNYTYDGVDNMVCGLNFLNIYAHDAIHPYGYERIGMNSREFYYVNSFGHLLAKFFYTNDNPNNNNIMIRFMRNELIDKKNINLLTQRIEFYEHRGCWSRSYAYSALDLLLFIVFAPNRAWTLIASNLSNRMKPHSAEIKYTHTTESYLDFLKEILFDRDCQFVVDEYQYVQICVNLLNGQKYHFAPISLNNPLYYCENCMMLPYIENMFGRIRPAEQKTSENKIKIFRTDKYVIREIFEKKCYLLLDIYLGNQCIIDNYGAHFANFFAGHKPKEVVQFMPYKNIYAFLISPIQTFRLVERRNFKLVKFLFSKHKKLMSGYVNRTGENLLEVACGSHGLNQNIIQLFIRSGLFCTKKIVVLNRKVRRDIDLLIDE
jgi:hypothetical protein